MLMDTKTGAAPAHINKCFSLAVALFRTMKPLLESDDKVIKELLERVPRYSVTRENHTCVVSFHNFLVRITERVEHLVSSRCADEYDSAEDELSFKLAVMGLDSHGLEENDRLPKRYTPAIGEWAAYHYSLAIGATVGSDEYNKLVKVLNAKVTERTNINYVRAIRTALASILPMPSDYELDKAKSILTLNHIDSIISAHSKIMNELLGTEIEEETLQTSGGVTWTVVEPTQTTTQDTKPRVVTMQDKNQKNKLASLLKRTQQAAN